MRILRTALVGVVVLAGLWAAPASAASIAPQVMLVADGEDFTVPLTQLRKGWAIGDQQGEDGGYFWMIEQAGFSVRLSGMLDPDPSIAYGIAVVDFGAPSVFGFLFFTPIVPVGAPNVVTGSIVGGLTDFTGDGVSLTPTGPTTQSSAVSFPATNLGVDVGAPFAAGPGAPGSFYAYGPYAAGPTAGPGPGPWTGLSVSASFGLSGGGDVAALTGFSSINEAPVPEPVTGLLLTLGLGGALAARRRSL